MQNEQIKVNITLVVAKESFRKATIPPRYRTSLVSREQPQPEQSTTSYFFTTSNESYDYQQGWIFIKPELEPEQKATFIILSRINGWH